MLGSIFCAVPVAVAGLVTIASWPAVPARVVTHWSLSGSPTSSDNSVSVAVVSGLLMLLFGGAGVACAWSRVRNGDVGTAVFSGFAGLLSGLWIAVLWTAVLGAGGLGLRWWLVPIGAAWGALTHVALKQSRRRSAAAAAPSDVPRAEHPSMRS